MKKYKVWVRIPYLYEVEASSPTEAKEKALEEFFDDSRELFSISPEVEVQEV